MSMKTIQKQFLKAFKLLWVFQALSGRRLMLFSACSVSQNDGKPSFQLKIVFEKNTFLNNRF